MIGAQLAAWNPFDRRVRAFPAADVTTLGREDEPRLGGLAQGDVEAIWRAVVGLYRTGLHPAIALCLRRHGHVVLDRAIGHARGNAPGEPRKAPKVLATPDTLFNLFSASKAVTAMVAHLLDERRLIHLDDPVAEYVPEFAAHGKRWITLRHVLTHRAGIPSVPAEHLDMDLLTDEDAITEILCDTRPTWAPGRRLAYHALTGGFVIGAVVKRVTGRSIREVLGSEILEPLGFAHLNYGVAPAELGQVARHAFTGAPLLPPASILMRRALGVDMERAVELSNDPRFLTSVIPAGNVIGTANEACRFFQLMLNEGELDGTRIFDRRTVQRAVAETSYLEVDLTIGLPIRYGMGFMLGGRTLSFFGPDSPRAFGHLGFTNVILWADPERDIAVSLMTTGKPFFSPRLVYLFEVVRRIAARCPKVPRPVRAA